MRISGGVTRLGWSGLVFAAGLMFALPLCAQFTAPTSDELKMTADVKAPGADAVILDREEDKDNQEWTWFVHLRIKVLTEKGKELATIKTPFDPGLYGKLEAQARTIHVDGTIVPMTDPPKEMTDFKTKDYELKSMVFNMPSVEVGSILEYWIRIKNGRTDTDWEIQEHHLIRRAHFSFRPGIHEDTMYASRIGPGQPQVKYAKGWYTLDLTDVPPIPDEDWMPPLNVLRWQVLFYNSEFKDAKEFWDSATKRWGTVVDDFTKPTGTLKKAVEGLVAAGDSEDQKARKIYDELQKLDNTSFSRVKSKAERKKEKLKDVKKAEDIWKQRSGSGSGIALLYVAMARAAGLKVKAMQVVNRDTAIWDGSILSTEQLDDFIVIATLDGKDVTLDPGEKMCPFGVLHWKHTLASGFLNSEKNVSLWTTPAPTFKDSVIQRAAYLEMDAEGKIDGIVRIAMTGPEALYWRQLALKQDEDEVKKQFGEWVKKNIPTGIEANFDHFVGMDDLKSAVLGIVKVNGQLGAATGKRFFVPGLFFEANATHPFVALDERKTPIDVEFPRTDVDDVMYKLPPGYAMEGAAPAADVAWPGFAAMRITPEVQDDKVSVKRILQYNFVLLGAKKYPDLHGFYQKVATADQQQLVLIKTAAGASAGTGK